jgi:MFS family permease
MPRIPAPAQEHEDAELTERAYRKVSSRLIPFLFLCYVVAYLDRINVGWAKLQMLGDLHFTDTIYGLGAGIFFIGYFLFEVPSNVLLHRVGARAWIARIMITWGVVSGATVLVKSPAQFYALRFLLGLAEAGFFPGIILYLTYWYPASRRGRWTAAFMTAVPLSGVVGGPLSGWLLRAFSGYAGLSGWQWLLLLEAVPSVVLGFATLAYLDNGIRFAKWLSEHEKTLLTEAISADAKEKPDVPLRSVFLDLRVWWMSFIYFSFVMGLYGVTFWLPAIVRSIPVKDAFVVGCLTAIPYFVSALAMVFVARNADRTRERRWHLGIPALVGAAGLLLSTVYAHQVGFAMVALTIATSGIITTLPNFWALPTAFLGGTAAAAGIAIINSLGNLAGFVSPYVVGWLKDKTFTTDTGMFVLAGSLLVGAALTFAVPARLVNK